MLAVATAAILGGAEEPVLRLILALLFAALYCTRCATCQPWPGSGERWRRSNELRLCRKGVLRPRATLPMVWPEMEQRRKRAQPARDLSTVREALRECCKQRGGRSVVPERLANVGVTIEVAGTEDEASTELERIVAQAVLLMTGGSCPVPRDSIFGPQEMEQGSGSQARRAICLPALVDQKRKRDAGLFAEEARIVPVAQPDGGETGPFFTEFPFVLAQLRSMLAAEDSTVVTKKNDNRRAISPQRPEPDLTALGVGQNDSSEPAAERVIHGDTFSIALAGLSTRRAA